LTVEPAGVPWKRLLWFVGIWAGSIVALAIVASLLRLILKA
jgi:hypothetical protein